MEENPIQQPIQPPSLSKPPLKLPLTILIVVMLGVVGYAGASYYLNLWPFEVSAPVSVSNLPEKTADLDNRKIDEKKLSGLIFFIKEGDLWQLDVTNNAAIKLIDLDNIQKFSVSPDQNRIAYSLAKTVKENVTEFDGTKHDVEVVKHQLLLADGKGTSSIFIQDKITSYGWIPSSDLLWYETAELNQEWGSWVYGGSGTLWIFDPTTKKAEKFFQDDTDFYPLLNAQWSPDGTRLMFVSSEMLKVADRKTKTVKTLIKNPYVGGDRGGPQPIPYFEWATDSLSIYAIFSPFAVSDSPMQIGNIQLREKYITAIKIPVDGSQPTELMPKQPSDIVNEESYPRAQFSEDFKKIIYPRSLDGKIVLAMYDTVENKEYILLQQPGTPERGLMRDGVPLAWVKDDSVYVFRGDGDWLYGKASVSLIKVNYKTGHSETLASKEGLKLFVSSFIFLPDQEKLFFTSEGNLYVMDRNGVSTLIDKLGDFPGIEYRFK